MHYHAARLYFTEESSYRAVGRQLGIAPLTAPFAGLMSWGKTAKALKRWLRN